MNFTLRKEDRQAVDLLLDGASQAALGAAGSSSVYAAVDPTIGGRVAQAQNLLHVLDLLPGIDPPPDLVSRTLRLVQQADGGAAASHHRLPTAIETRQPHA